METASVIRQYNIRFCGRFDRIDPDCGAARVTGAAALPQARRNIIILIFFSSITRLAVKNIIVLSIVRGPVPAVLTRTQQQYYCMCRTRRSLFNAIIFDAKLTFYNPAATAKIRPGHFWRFRQRTNSKFYKKKHVSRSAFLRKSTKIRAKSRSNKHELNYE